MINTPHTDIPIDRSRHLSQDQSNSYPPPIDRTTKTQYSSKTLPITIHSTNSMKTSQQKRLKLETEPTLGEDI